MEIKIRCKGNRQISHDKLRHFQGSLKEMSVVNAKKLRESILRHGWIAPEYCDVILSRWPEFTGKDPIREDGKKWSEAKKCP